MARLQRGSGGAGKQRGVEQEVGLVHERHPRALGRQQTLQGARGVEAPEAAARDHDLPGHGYRIGCRSVNDSLYANALAPFLAEAQRLRPAHAEVIDAHTHLGLDEDGRSLTLAQLLSQLDRAGARRACVFPLHDPERKPAYRVPNDRVLAWAAESEGRLVPFCRLDPAEEPLAEAERCLATGARGIKLHPRAQDFDFDGREMDDVFKLAEGAGVPILIHAGRGLPPLADGARRARPAPPGSRSHPGARRDLRPGDPHLAPGRPPGRAV